MNDIHWFPGHMKKALNNIKEQIKRVDLIIEVIDARSPLSSIDDNLHKLTKNKDHLLVLAKKDLADDEITIKWLTYFRDLKENVIALDLSNEKERRKLISFAKKCAVKKVIKEKKLGIKPQPIKAMILGVPNVGKSTLINRFASKRLTKVENKAGCTRNERWLKVDDGFELLDTPGVLPMKYENKIKSINLALIGSISDNILPIVDLAKYLIDFCNKYYVDAIKNRYQINEQDSDEVLKQIAVKRGFISNNNVDYYKAGIALLTDFRSAKLGKISLEFPEK